MDTGSLTRRAFGTLAAAALATACVVGCSSSTGGAGTGATGGTTSQPPGVTVTSGGGGGGPTQQAPSVSVPVSLPVSISIGNSAGGTAFCKDFNLQKFSQLQTDPNQIKDYIGLIDKLTNEAPPAIKSVMQQLDAFAHSVAAGHLPSAADKRKLTPLAEQLGLWVASHCTKA
jgi:hypothetical protein